MKGGLGIKKFCPHPNELFIWAYAENLVEIGLLVEAVDTFCGTARGTGKTSRLYRQPQPGLSLALALAEVCQQTTGKMHAKVLFIDFLSLYHF